MCPPLTPLYNFNSKTCTACPQNTTYNSDTNVCDQSRAVNTTSVNIKHFGIVTNQTNSTSMSLSNFTNTTNILVNSTIPSINSTTASSFNYSDTIINNTSVNNNSLNSNASFL